MRVKVPDYVNSLLPYKPGNQQVSVNSRPETEQYFSLASNENPLGPSASVIEAIKKAAGNVAAYPDPVSDILTSQIAETYGKHKNQIVFGHGSESLIAHIVNAFSNINTRVLTSRGTFAGIYVKTHKIGRKLNRVPMTDHSYDLDKLLDRIHPNTSIIYISNPNNPTGSMIKKKDWEHFIKQVPENILILLDEAYCTYAAEHDGYFEGMEYDLPNLIVLRTLSKTHGLAGLRIGYAVGPAELIDTLYKVKLPFEPNILAQAAAVAALRDDKYIAETLKVNRISLDIMMELFDKLNVEYVYPYGNYLMVIFDNQLIAAEFCRISREYGITLRHCKPFGIAEGVRISSATLEQTKYAVNVFKKAYDEIMSCNNDDSILVQRVIKDNMAD